MKVRTPIRRRRVSVQAQARAWSGVFTSGWDFFDDLAALGFADEADVEAAVEAAWRRLGALFLEQYTPSTPTSRPPWALETFGPP